MRTLLLLLCFAGGLMVPAQAAAPADQASLSEKKESYQKRVEDDLDKLSQKMRELRRRSEKAGADSRQEVDRQIDTLEKKLAVAQNKLAGLKNQTAENWEQFRKGLDKAVADLKKSFGKTESKLK